MTDTWGTRGQASNRDPGRLRAEHIFLIVAAVSLSAAVAAYVLDSTLPIDLNRGAYAIMVTLSLMGFCGWLSRSAERRHRRVAYGELGRLTAVVDVVVSEVRRLAAAVEELRDQVEDLREQVERQRTVYLPPTHRKPNEGARHLPAAAGDDAAPLRTGLDPESIAAAKALARRIVDGPAEARRDAE